jgi:hypothetical protein
LVKRINEGAELFAPFCARVLLGWKYGVGHFVDW